jgi:hypothetical protein
MNRETETILVGFDYYKDKDTAVLIVGKKRPNNSVDIINSFEGKEAIELWGKLTVKEAGR